jgi:hypothetical protein
LENRQSNEIGRNGNISGKNVPIFTTTKNLQKNDSFLLLLLLRQLRQLRVNRVSTPHGPS